MKQRNVIVYKDCHQNEVDYPGIFCQFGCAYEEFENGTGNYTTVIVEKKDGTLKQPEIPYVRFID